MKRIVAAALLAGTAFAATSASAARLHIVWSGESYGNSAKAVGYLDFWDDPSIAQPGHYPIDMLTDMGVTVSGAAQGNGTFGPADFSLFYLDLPIGVNFAHELIGQNLGNGHHFGDGSPYGGAFGLYGTTLFPLSPFVAMTASGEKLRIVSMQYAQYGDISVPEPASWAMMIGGFGLVGAAMRRRHVRVSFG